MKTRNSKLETPACIRLRRGKRNKFQIPSSKNVALVILGAVLACASLAQGLMAAESSFKKIFDGKDLKGWDGDPTLWSVKDGSIVGQTTAEHPIKHNTFLIWTNGEVGDFEFRCKFRITAQNEKGFANSGIQYRSKVLD